APELHLEDARTILPTSRCPGLEEYDARTPQTTWACVEMKVTVFYDGDMHGCPWIVSSYVKSEDATEAIYTGNNVPYIGPTKVSSDCSAIPLDPYDVSWNENTVVHNKIVRMQSTGAVIEQTLPTYLMEGGKLCDGSKYDERGAYCRFVAQQMTFSTSGCDDAKVTVTPEPQPITSRQLHDMKLRVDTTAQQPIDATCRFTYILNMY
ncbi:TPA: StfH/YfcO family fimbrial adhesin, partial [Escherichia coli]